MKKQHLFFWLCLFCSLSFFLPYKGLPLEKGRHYRNVEKVIYTGKESPRELAERYFGDPEEWLLILHSNGMRHPSELKKGLSLNIPVELFDQVNRFLKKTEKILRKANLMGAGLLAKNAYMSAVRSRDQAMARKNNGDLNQAKKSAVEALKWAEKALYTSRDKRIRTVSAMIDSKTGDVESRRPEAHVWNNVKLLQELIAYEKVRTLSESTAGILFVDESHILLDENSLAVIGDMKEDVIKKIFHANVLVMEGDALVHLSSSGGRKRFTVNAPGIETKVRSKFFRTSRDRARVTRIANYDGEIDVEAMKRNITIRKNEGTKIESGKPPADPRKLILPPEMIEPVSGQIFFSDRIQFKWKKTEKAEWYELDISPRNDFSVISKQIRTKKTKYEWAVPKRGMFFCRIHAVDNDDFSGPFSKPVSFFADQDHLPPYLFVESPKEDASVSSCQVMIRGTTEKKASLFIDKTPCPLDDQGRFRYSLDIGPGTRTIEISAVDRAGNTSRIKRTVTCLEKEPLISLKTPTVIQTNSGQVVIEGKLLKGTRVRINGKPETLPETFSRIFFLGEGKHTILFEGENENGRKEKRAVEVIVDLTPPNFQIGPISRYTKKARLLLTGILSEPAELYIGGEKVPVKEFGFSKELNLVEGENRFSLKTVDRAGNEAFRNVSVFRDTTGPDITFYKMFSERTGEGKWVTCKAGVKDTGVGFAKNGKFAISMPPDDRLFRGILSFNNVSGVFEGNIVVPMEMAGKPLLKEIVVHDHLGNETALR